MALSVPDEQSSLRVKGALRKHGRGWRNERKRTLVVGRAPSRTAAPWTYASPAPRGLTPPAAPRRASSPAPAALVAGGR